MIKEILRYPEKVLGVVINTRFFSILLSFPLLTTLTLVIIAAFWSFPSYDLMFINTDMHQNWTAIFLQAEDPFLDHKDIYSHGSHSEKLAFRFVPALLLHILHIDNILPALIFQFLTLVLFYYLLVIIFNKLFVEKKKAFLYALPFCFVISGHVYASDYRGMFDTLALDFILIAILFRDKIYVVIPLLLAYFTDERALIASPAIFLLNIFISGNYTTLHSIFKEIVRVSNIYLISSWIIYFMCRITLHYTLGLTSGSGEDCFLFLEQINKTFYTIYIGLEGFIIPFIFIIYYLLKNKNYTYSLLIILSFLLLFFVAQSVLDINRSMSYVILIQILIILLFDRFYSKETVFKIIALVIMINIFYDDFYPFLAQVYRMKFITHSI